MESIKAVITRELNLDRAHYPLHERLYLLLAGTFCVLLVLTNVIGTKLFEAPHDSSFSLTTGLLTYPLTFLVTDVVSEIYGKKRADFMVLVGFLMSLLMVLVVQAAIAVPEASIWVLPETRCCATSEDYQEAFSGVFAINQLLLFGSMTAYLCAQLIDNYLFHFWRRFTGGRHLWLRNNLSTPISQAVDTLIVGSVVFYWGFGWEIGQGLVVMATIYAYKLTIALVDTPLVYLCIYVVKRQLGGTYAVKPADQIV